MNAYMHPGKEGLLCLHESKFHIIQCLAIKSTLVYLDNYINSCNNLQPNNEKVLN